MSTQSTFHELVGELDYSMFIVTTASEGDRAGCLVGFATQCSIDPARFLVCLSDKNRTYRLACAAEALAVHFVSEEAGALVDLFGSHTGDDVDKFARCAWHAGPLGLPVLDDCANWFAGRILDRRPVGDHAAFLLEPVGAAKGDTGRAFPFHRARRLQPGHEA